MYKSNMNTLTNAGFDSLSEMSIAGGGTEAHDCGAHWYAVRTRSRHEKMAAAMLASVDVEHYAPLRSKLSQWSDRKQVVELPVFSGYLFVRINLLKDSRLKVLKSPGVVSFIGNHSGPSAILDKEIEDIRTVLASKVEYAPCSSLEKGDRVRVIRGAFVGVEGTLVGRNSPSRLLVSIETIQQSLSLSISTADVELICAGAPPAVSFDRWAAAY
jgi:transcription antitermination factor NusG